MRRKVRQVKVGLDDLTISIWRSSLLTSFWCAKKYGREMQSINHLVTFIMIDNFRQHIVHTFGPPSTLRTVGGVCILPFE